MSAVTEKDWITKAGFRAVVLMIGNRNRCGYVAVDKNHPLHGVEEDEATNYLPEIEDGTPVGKRGVLSILSATLEERWNSPDIVFNVHGGITYSGGSEDYPVKNKGLWWFGFDCSHAGDKPSPEYLAELERDCPEVNYSELYSDGVHRTLEYCIDECESLAKQIKEKTIYKATLIKRLLQYIKRGLS